MANNSKADVLMLFGVEGGSSITSGSGQDMYNDIKEIVEAIQNNITKQLQFGVSADALEDLRSQVEDAVTEALTSIKGTPVELTFSFNQDSIDKAFRDVKKQLKEQNITISAQPQEKKQKQGAGSTGSAGEANSSTSLDNIKKEAEATKQGVKEVEKVAESVSKETQQSLNAERQITSEKIKQKDIVESQNVISDEQRLQIEKQITLERERQAFYTSKQESSSKTYLLSDDYTATDKTRLKELSHLYDRSKRVNYYNSMSVWADADEKLAIETGLEGGDLQNYKAEKKMVDIIHRQVSGVIEASATVYANSLKAALSQVAKDIKWEWANEIVKSFKEYDDRYAVIENEDFITNTPYSHFIFHTNALDFDDADDPNVDDIYTKVFKEKQEWYIQAVEFTDAASNFYSAIDDINQQMKPLEDTLSSYQSFNNPSKVKFNSSSTKNSLFSQYDYANFIAGRHGIYRQTESGAYVVDAPNTFSRQPEMWRQYEAQLKEYANYLDQYRDYIFDYASQVKQDAINAFTDTGDIHEYQKVLDNNKEHLDTLVQGYIEEYNRYNDVLNKGNYNPENFPIYTQFEDYAKQAKTNLNIVESEIVSTTEAAKKLEEVQDKLEIKIPTLPSEESSVSIATISDAYSEFADKMQSLNSDTADEAIDRVTESIEAQNDALRENTEAIEENQQAQKKAENTIPKSYLNDINKLNASQTVMSSRQGYDKVSTGASQTLGDINAIYQAIHDDNYDNVQAIGIENYAQAIEKLGQLLPLAKEQLKQTGKELDTLDKKAEKAEEAERKLASQLDVTIAKATARRDVLKSALTNIDDSQFKIQNPDDTKKLNDNVSSVSKLIDKLEEYYSIVSAGKDIAENFWDDVDDVDSLNSAVKKLNSTLSITEANLKSVGIDTANIPTDAAASAINKFNEALRQFKATSGANQYQDLFGLSEMVGLGDKSLEYVIAETQRLTTATRQLSAANREEQNVITQRNKIYQEAVNYYNKYQSGIRANIALNQKWQDTLKKLHDGGFGDNETARRALAELQTATKDANAETMTLWGSLKKLFTDHFGSVSATAFIGTLRNVLRGAYQNVLEIDKAMTELRKVTNLTEQQYESFQARVADTAREVGGSIADTIRSTADYSRLGFNLPDSESLAKAALVYKNVGDGLENIDEASESIISTIKAFSDVNASDAMSIIDKFNEVGETSVELPTPRLIQNRWQIAISVNGWRQLRPREGYYIYCY